ncbi:hypothetical protein Ctob_008869, partial [Chrysochromulina tobinii]
MAKHISDGDVQRAKSLAITEAEVERIEQQAMGSHGEQVGGRQPSGPHSGVSPELRRRVLELDRVSDALVEAKMTVAQYALELEEARQQLKALKGRTTSAKAEEELQHLTEVHDYHYFGFATSNIAALNGGNYTVALGGASSHGTLRTKHFETRGHLSPRMRYEIHRVERVTQPALQVQQLVGFCWVRPAETFDGFVSEAYAARRWPCGGFFYFFDQSEQPEQQPLEEAPLAAGEARRPCGSEWVDWRALSCVGLLWLLGQKLTVRVEGVLPSSASHDEITWYRLREEIDHRIDRTAWLKIKSEDEVFTRYQDVWSTSGLSSQDAADEDEALQERISHVLLPAKTRRRRLEMEDRIEVFTPTKEGVEIGPANGPVVADARFWRQLRVRHDLGPSSAPASRLRVRPFGPSIFGFDDCWQLTPLEKELNPERHVAKDELCRQLERALTKLEKRLGACMSLLAAPCSACTLPLRHYLRCACLQKEQLPPPLTVGMSVILGGFVGCSIVALHGDGSVDVHIPGCGIRPRVARTSLRLLDGSPAPPATAPQASRSPWMSCMEQIWSGWVWVPPPVSATASQISPTATVDSSASTDTTEARRAVQALRDALRHEPVVLNSTPPSKCEHSEGPRLMHLVLPLSCMHSSVSRTRRSTAEGVSEGIGIGIGAELYFMQLITLGWVFLLMGLVSLGSMLNNYFVYFKLHSTALGSWEPNVTAVDVILQGLTIGANTGQRGTPFNLLQVGCSELVTTLVFLLYLIWLKQFNAERELALKKSALSAADYTIQ